MSEADAEMRGDEPSRKRIKVGRQPSVEDVKWMTERGWVILVEKDLLWENPDPIFQCPNNAGATTAWTLPQRYRGTKYGSDLQAESCHNCFVMRRKCPRSGIRPSKDEVTGSMMTWRVRWTEEEGWDRIGVNGDGVEVASESARKLVKRNKPSTILHLEMMTAPQLNARLKQCLDEAAQIQQWLARLLSEDHARPEDARSPAGPSNNPREASISEGSPA